MIAALRGAVYEGLKRQEEVLAMYTRLGNEAKDKVLKDIFTTLAIDVKKDIETMKRLNLHSIVKFGLAIQFRTSPFSIDERHAKAIKDVEGAKEILKLAIDEINAEIEYYEHIADHSIFPEVKRLFRMIADKLLDQKSKLKALQDLLE